jgi:hypothetical protein
MEGYLRSYIYNPNLYTMPVFQAKEMVESYCTVPDDNSPVMGWEGSGAKSVVGSEVNPYGATAAQSPGVQVNHSLSQFPTDAKPQKLKELINLILCWRNIEGDVRKKGVPQGGRKQGAGGLDPRGLKRKTAERTLNYRKKASQERGRRDRRTGMENLTEDWPYTEPKLAARMHHRAYIYIVSPTKNAITTRRLKYQSKL